ncbi:MAG: ATP-binding protein [Chloroflexi bacterium]|nr:ATP-binding protein [Chloroflexota bacterium]MCI0576209.1 ATP-binding protein [Chloroflexota bacterium]MCI0645497.1 ATP-binding protein [Chloroflexota bacterium]MCI0730636.1 ATP-binding protein [Chloroflexota bacterium]
MGKQHEFTIPGRYDRIGEVCDFVAAGAEEAGLEPDDVFRVQLACDEACTNIIEHAYGAENKGEIEVIWQYSKDVFTITIHDHGEPFDPDEVPQPIVPTDANDMDNLKIGGLGIHFMRSLMDEVYFSFDDNRGNTLVMIKRLPRRNKP